MFLLIGFYILVIAVESFKMVDGLWGLYIDTFQLNIGDIPCRQVAQNPRTIGFQKMGKPKPVEHTPCQKKTDSIGLFDSFLLWFAV